MESIDLQVARLQERVGVLHVAVADIQTDQKAQNAKLDRLLGDHQQRKGATKAIRAVVTVLGSGGFLGWIWEHFFTRHP